MVLILTILMNRPTFFHLMLEFHNNLMLTILSEILASQAPAFMKYQFEFYI